MTVTMPARPEVEESEDRAMTRDELLAVEDARRKYVHVPDWGRGVWIQRLGLLDRLAWLDAHPDLGVDRGPLAVMRANADLLVLSICDEDGTRLLRPEDAEALLNKSQEAIEILVGAALEVNGLLGEDVDAAEGKSGATPSGE